MIMEAGNVASARTPRMPQATRHDAWQAGDAYEQYMGRWSRRIAPRSVDWLSPEPGLDWLDVGCGTGALSEAGLGRSDPGSLGRSEEHTSERQSIMRRSYAGLCVKEKRIKRTVL